MVDMAPFMIMSVNMHKCNAVTHAVTGRLAWGQENCQRGGVNAFDPQDW